MGVGDGKPDGWQQEGAESREGEEKGRGTSIGDGLVKGIVNALIGPLAQLGGGE
jgi:hypothetical protein